MLRQRLALMALLCAATSLAAAQPSAPLVPLPLGNLTTYTGRLLERRAAAAVATAVPAPWVALDPALVARTIDELALPTPLGTAEIQRLCDRLAQLGPTPAAACGGALTEFKLERDAVQLSLYLELIEPLSGEMIGRGWGKVRLRFDRPTPADARVEAALREAVRAAVAEMAPPPLVLGQTAGPAQGQTVTLKLAANVRLQTGAVALLLGVPGEHGAVPLAAVVVEKVREGAADCRILGTRGAVTAGLTALGVGKLP